MHDRHDREKARARGILRMRASGSTVVREVLLPVQAFLRTEGRSGIVLLLAALLALAWANSPISHSYFALWESRVTLDLGLLTVSHDLRHWVNDGLMSLFFLVVGLEVKRELVHGELTDPRRAALPVAGAIGGMVLPAALFVVLNVGGPGAPGWGIPMATDIAFAIGVLALLGPRIPSELRLFLLVLAVVDDVGAILVIAIFYTAQVHAVALLAAAGVVGVILVMRRAGVQSIMAYLVPALLLWLAVHESGVHATIAGVVLALLTPVEPAYTPAGFADALTGLTERLRSALAGGRGDEVNAVLGEIEEFSRLTEAPVERIERRIHPWSNYVILPLFALANAGLELGRQAATRAMESPVTLGIVLGLIIGKPVGITAFSWIATRLRMATLPAGTSWPAIAGAGFLAGIGFTVSLFIAGLAYEGDPLTSEAKMGILIASALAGSLGYLILRGVTATPARA